jgi:hypothetical protein
MLFVKRDLRDKKYNTIITHGNILKDGVILISSFYENHRIMDINKNDDLFLQSNESDCLRVFIIELIIEPTTFTILLKYFIKPDLIFFRFYLIISV